MIKKQIIHAIRYISVQIIFNTTFNEAHKELMGNHWTETIMPIPSVFSFSFLRMLMAVKCMNDWLNGLMFVSAAGGGESGWDGGLLVIRTDQNLLTSELWTKYDETAFNVKINAGGIGVRCLTTRNWNEFIVSADSWLIVNEWQRTNNSNSKQNISSWNMQWMTFHLIF